MVVGGGGRRKTAREQNLKLFFFSSFPDLPKYKCWVGGISPTHDCHHPPGCPEGHSAFWRQWGRGQEVPLDAEAEWLPQVEEMSWTKAPGTGGCQSCRDQQMAGSQHPVQAFALWERGLQAQLLSTTIIWRCSPKDLWVLVGPHLSPGCGADHRQHSLHADTIFPLVVHGAWGSQVPSSGHLQPID